VEVYKEEERNKKKLKNSNKMIRTSNVDNNCHVSLPNKNDNNKNNNTVQLGIN